MIKQRLVIVLASTAAIIALSSGVASAHVVVQPDQVGIGKFQTFTVSVPNEKQVPVTDLRLVLPSGVQEVTPAVKAGWQVNVKKSDKDVATEVDWTGGAIPVGLRDDFTFSAQASAQPSTLVWKTYQTYQDGTVVSWDQAPKNGSDDATGNSGPYSTTQVINDLTPSATAASTVTSTKLYGAYALGTVALAIAVLSFVAKRKK